MSTNGINITDDADMAECDGEKVVTMMDVLQEQQDFEEDANAVLGASDDKNCTFDKGYIKRQALYACLTCCSDARDDPTKRAGVCLACSLNCHENHELIELYTKRNFRCDCGNPKFNSHPCQYTPDKQDLNKENSYNQNFSGLYCTCHRPYPDPEAEFEDEMIQCIICEDWLHASHLEATLPSNELYAEMVCKACMEKNEFLHDYSELAVNIETAEVDVTSISIIAEEKTNGNDTPKVNGLFESSNISDDKDIKTDIEMTESENAKNIGELTTEDNDKNNKIESSKESTENTDQNIENKESDIPHTTDENKMGMPVPDTTDSKEEDNVQDQSKKESESLIETTNDKPEEITASTTENDDSRIESINNGTPSESMVKDDETKADENSDKKDNSLPEENKIETTTDDIVHRNENNDNSIIESIKKLESELGNVEPKDNLAENEQTNNDTHNMESKDKNSISADSASENNVESVAKETETRENESETSAENSSKVEIAKPDTSDVVMDGEKAENIDSENEINNEESAETKENLLNGKIEDSKPADESNEDIEECPTKDSKRKFSTEESDEMATKKPKLDETSCCSRPRGVKRVFKGATFWPSNFRQKLCTCSECISMYKDLSVLFLTDLEDTVTAYEALGKQKAEGTTSSQYERGLEALSSLDRIQQINALTEYNKMRDRLLDFLKSFKDRKEVVKEEDIKAFFAGMKPKRQPDGVYFCR